MSNSNFLNFINKISEQPSIFLVVDENLTNNKQAKHIEVFLREKFKNLFLYYLSAGEAIKTRKNKAQLEDRLFSDGCDRSSLLIAVGGGTIGDLVGFVAATFMRGIKYVQIPTTLLAMVDSSIGGKVAINTKYGKNTLGSFWSPEEILVFPEFLNTLPYKELHNGFMEIIKTSLVDNSNFNNSNLLKSISLIDTSLSDQQKLLAIIEECITIKKMIVLRDPFDNSERAKLNLGHTLAHALERVSNYEIMHGRAVAYGCVFATYISYQRGLIKIELFDEIKALFSKWGIDFFDLKQYEFANDFDTLYNFMLKDKKSNNKIINMVLITDNGAYKKDDKYTVAVTYQELSSAYNLLINSL